MLAKVIISAGGCLIKGKSLLICLIADGINGLFKAACPLGPNVLL